MSKKPLLNEEVARKFMKLAAIPAITRDKFLSEAYMEEEEELGGEEMPPEGGEEMPPMEDEPIEDEAGDLGDMEIEPAEESAGTAEDLAEKIVDLLAGEGLVEKEDDGGEEELGVDDELGGMEDFPPEGGEEELLEEEDLDERRGPHDVSHGRGVEGLEESIEIVDEKQLLENILNRVIKRLA